MNRNLPRKDVRYNFYRTILEWARNHNAEIINRSRGELSEADATLEPADMPINRIFIPPVDY